MPLPPLEEDKKQNKLDEKFILYLSTGDEMSKGIVYQVDDSGAILGKVNLPYTATGIATHRNNALIGVIPRDGGQIVRIDDTGKVSVILNKAKGLPHPIRVALPKDSDSIVIADDITNELLITNIGGLKPINPKPNEKLNKMVNPSVAVDGTTIRFNENRQVSADSSSGRWAVSKGKDKIEINEEDKVVKTLTLPNGKTFYKGGLMSWSGFGTLCVACQGNDGVPWFLMYDVDKDKIRTLFPWKSDEVQSFVVAPRMRWDRKSPKDIKTIY